MKGLRATLALTLLLASIPAYGQEVKTKVTAGDVLNLYGQSKFYYPAGSGTWWRNPSLVKKLGLSLEQQKKMDEILQQHRLKLIDLNASLQKEELVLEPLLAEVRPEDATRILAQIDKVAQARAELEKGNARMLLGIRQVLTQEQWNNLPALGNSKMKYTGPLWPYTKP